MNGVLSMPAEQYHAAEGVSKSMLDYIAPPDFMPSHYRARFITGELKQDETPALRMGSLTHRVILEPETITGAFYVKPEDMSFTTKEGKAWKSEHGDRMIIGAEEARSIQGMRDAVWRHTAAKRLLNGEMERSLFAQDAEGTFRKARLDCLTLGNIVPDLKTTITTETRALEKVVLDQRYHVQLAYYCDICKLLGIEKEIGVLIFVEKTPPYDVVCHHIEDEILELGRREYKADLARLRNCLATGEWPGRDPDGISPIGLPPWHMKRLEQEAA